MMHTRAHRCRTSKRAFTLIELCVGLTLGLGVISVAMALTVGTIARVRHSRVLAQLHRDGSFAARHIEDDLRHAGLGVPPGPHIMTEERLIPMLVASSTELGILGDVARPDAQYNTFGTLHSRPTRSRDSARGGAAAAAAVAWHTENNGACMPGAPGDGCQANGSSVFFPSSNASDSCTVTADDRVCPWGVRRVRPGDDLQIVAADKSWATSRAAGTTSLLMLPGLAADDASGLLAAPVSLRLADPFEPGRLFRQVFKASDTDPARWRDHEPGTLPGGSVGQGFVTTLDRVFFFVSSRKLMRVQCWGKPDPEAPSWPPLSGANAVPASIKAGIAGDQCTPPEAIARDVVSLSLRYFDALDAPISGDARTSARRVEFELTLKRDANGDRRAAQYVVSGSVALQNS
jgi:hypothetical protein